MACRNLQHSGPPGPGQCTRLMGALLNQRYAGRHSGQASPNTAVNYLSRPEIVARAREDQQAQGIFIASEPQSEDQSSRPTKAGEPGLQTRPAPDRAAQPEGASVGSFLEHLWSAASGYFEAMHPAPGPSHPIAAPAPEAQPPVPSAESPTSAKELSPERLERRKALALLRTQGRLNGAQAREVFDAYKAAGIPINAHTVSPYHAWNMAGDLESLTKPNRNGLYKTSFMLDGQRHTRVVKLRHCPHDAPEQAKFAFGLEKPFPGGRHCELHALSGSAINKYLNWDVMPDCWIGSFRNKDGRLHLALVMEYLQGEEASIGLYKHEAYFMLRMERIAMISGVVGEPDHATPHVVERQINGQTLHHPYIIDLELAFDPYPALSPQPDAYGFPDSGFGPPRQLSTSTRNDFQRLLAPAVLRTLLAPFQIMNVIRAVEKRGAAMQGYCEQVEKNGKLL